VIKTVTVLGTGTMGAGMARNLASAGLDVTVWNRSPEKARVLSGAGAHFEEDVRSAVAGADVVVTTLFDADAVADVAEDALPAAPDGMVWVQTSTVGLDGTERLAGIAQQPGVTFVDAPVLGTRQPAEPGGLGVLAGPAGDPGHRGAGAGAARAGGELVAALGRRRHRAGRRPGRGRRDRPVALPRPDRRRTAGLRLHAAQGEGEGDDRGGVHARVHPGRRDDGLVARRRRDALRGHRRHADGGLYARFAAAAGAGHDGEDRAAVWHAFRIAS
jgi:3-hydroxyisobutyrate dehydrogenase